MKRLCALLLTIALSACSNAGMVAERPADAGTVRSFDANYEDVKAAALDGLSRLKLAPSQTEEKPEGYVILVARPPHGWSWGEVGRIPIERSAAPPTTVRVVYEKRTALQAASSESGFSRNLFAKMDEVLKS